MSWTCAPSRRTRNTSSTRRATSAASDFFFAIAGPHQFVDPARVPVVQPPVAGGRELLPVAVGPQVRRPLEHQPGAVAGVEAPHLAVAPGGREPGTARVLGEVGRELLE